MHVKNGGNVATHCVKYALSDPSNEKFKASPCDHDHNEVCEECHNLEMILQKFKISISKEDDETKYVIEEAVEDIIQWHHHILRTVNQDQARIDVLDALQENVS